MSVSLSLKLAEFPQNETIFDRIIAEFLVKIAAIFNISTGQLISELVTRASELVTRAIVVDPRRFHWTSGVTTMGSDQENPGAPNPNGPNGGPQA